MFPQLLALLLLALAPREISLFDGKTLAGWHVAARLEDRGKSFWKVQDGAITCDSIGHRDHDYVWLVSDGEFADFELRLKIHAFPDSTGNSGVQIRSRYDDSAHWMNGPQADVHSPAPFRTGLLYDETRETRRWIFPSLPDWKIEESQAPKRWSWNADGWNEMAIVCRGLRITTTVNGRIRADLDGAGILDDAAHRAHDVGRKGHIALQLHSGDETHIQYKDILLKL